MEKIDIFSPLLGNMMDIIVFDFDKSLQGLQIYVCAKFGCSSPDRLDRVFRQTELLCIIVRYLSSLKIQT